MDKLIRLELWKVYLIFLLPIMAMLILTNVGIGEAPIRHLYHAQIYTTFGVLCVLLVFCWQYSMGLAFFQQVHTKALLFKVNGFIPVAFYLLLFLFSLYDFARFLGRREIILERMNDGIKEVMGPIHLGIISTIFQVIILHSIITLFLNNRFVAKGISHIGDKEIRTAYLLTYLKPMRMVARTFIIVLVLIFGYVVFLDISSAFK